MEEFVKTRLPDGVAVPSQNLLKLLTQRLKLLTQRLSEVGVLSHVMPNIISQLTAVIVNAVAVIVNAAADASVKHVSDNISYTHAASTPQPVRRNTNP